MSSLSAKVKNLLIPRKGSNDTNDLDTNSRAVERWAQQVGQFAGTIQEIVAGANVTVTNGEGPVVTIAASGGSGGYASLTGAGQTTTPGDLQQDGGFTVLDTAGDGVVVTSETSGGRVDLLAGAPFGVNSSVALVPGSVSLFSTNGEVQMSAPLILAWVTGSFTSVYVRITGAVNPAVTIGPVSGTQIFTATATKVGFFGNSAIQQSSAGITTVAQLVTVLQTYGLLS